MSWLPRPTPRASRVFRGLPEERVSQPALLPSKQKDTCENKRLCMSIAHAQVIIYLRGVRPRARASVPPACSCIVVILYHCNSLPLHSIYSRVSELTELPKSTYLFQSFVQAIVSVAVQTSPGSSGRCTSRRRHRCRCCRTGSGSAHNGSSFLILCQNPGRVGIWQCELSAGLCSWAWAAGIWTRECISRLC